MRGVGLLVVVMGLETDSCGKPHGLHPPTVLRHDVLLEMEPSEMSWVDIHHDSHTLCYNARGAFHDGRGEAMVILEFCVLSSIH